MVKIRPEKNSGPTEFEPKTSAKPVQALPTELISQREAGHYFDSI